MSNQALAVLREHHGRPIPMAGVYAIDPDHTSVEFVARHLMITKVRGRFREVRGQIEIGDDPLDSHVEVEIATSSVDTGIDDRDAHLRSADFFEVDRYPLITFRSTVVRSWAGVSWDVLGDLTIRDQTHPVTLRVDADGAEVGPDGRMRVGFSAAAELNRERFGLTWNQALDTGGVLVGKVVRIELAVQAIASVSV
jgi:polyisoprenoid-binding protein YceI